MDISSGKFWDDIYAFGGTSGRGSYGRLAEFKAEVINGFVIEQNITSVVELGCGDGNQLSLGCYPEYLGLDVSPTAVQRCSARFVDDTTKSFELLVPGTPAHWAPRELALSLDVIYHLLEDDVYEDYMRKLFTSALRFIIVYSDDEESTSAWREVRHRKFSPWVAREAPEWELYRRIPQRYLRTNHEPETSWSDFFIYRRKASSE